jgi:dihydrofolate synthase / folylpolyglutamate synthase
MSFPEALDYLNSFSNFETEILTIAKTSRWKLERMQKLLSALGAPEKGLVTVQVAGTKGKGSVSALTAQIFKEAGYTVGLYTSPHLTSVRERIRVLDQKGSRGEAGDIFSDMISSVEFADLVGQYQPIFEDFRRDKGLGAVTYFEILTALGLLYFRQRGVDVAILETGLGGRLDATNAVDSSACAITSISLDHTAILGNTLKEIAREKAAIIKTRGQPVVVAEQRPEVLGVIQERCEQIGCAPLLVGKDIRVTDVSKQNEFPRVAIETPHNQYNLSCWLLGDFQNQNLAVAVGLAEYLAKQNKFLLKPEAVERAAKSVFWPGRFEIVSAQPIVVLDCAHNPDSAKHLAMSVEKNFNRKVTLILGISADKDWRAILMNLKPIAKDVCLTQAKNPRALEFPLDETKVIFKESPVNKISTVRDAVTQTLAKAGPDDILVVTGSVFVVAEAREFFTARAKVYAGLAAQRCGK